MLECEKNIGILEIDLVVFSTNTFLCFFATHARFSLQICGLRGTPPRLVVSFPSGDGHGSRLGYQRDHKDRSYSVLVNHFEAF